MMQAVTVFHSIATVTNIIIIIIIIIIIVVYYELSKRN